ncbi:ASTRA complex subunit [Bachmanniomyces sp. S44760]|nr:ASTRA complex subunit [Bachmanniomyces sp. S44760]
MPVELLPPIQPSYIFRGHASQVQSVHFYRQNARLLTGDAKGWVISWSLAYRRPVAAWKAHDEAVLGLGNWTQDRILSHGRDNKLIVWQLTKDDERTASKNLPVDDPEAHVKQPWILHVLNVNALNFCSFAMCDANQETHSTEELANLRDTGTVPKGVLLAVPNTDDSGGVDVFHLPSEARTAAIKSDKATNTGMVMAICIHEAQPWLHIAAGYEDGSVLVHRRNQQEPQWQKIYSYRTHSQPVLSLAASAQRDWLVSTSADAIVAKHPFVSLSSEVDIAVKPLNIVHTKHAGQQSASMRSDGKIFATAGWDARVRVYSARTMKELAVLKWHKDGCYSTAFAEVLNTTQVVDSDHTLTGEQGADMTIAVRTSKISNVQHARNYRAQFSHWLATGSKDNKVSLWEVY